MECWRFWGCGGGGGGKVRGVVLVEIVVVEELVEVS